MKKALLNKLKQYFEQVKYVGYVKQDIIENILIARFLCSILNNPDLELYISDTELTTIYNLIEYINLNDN